MALSQDEIKLIAKEVAQSVTQQAIEQALQQAQQTGGSLSSDKKVLGSTDVTEDTQTDEHIRGKSYNDAEMYAVNKKLLVEREQSTAQKSHDFDLALKEIQVAEAKIELARKQSDFNHQEQLKAIAVSEATQASIIKHFVNLEYTKFNAAVSEPINPNIGAAGAAKVAKATGKKK